MSLNHKPTSFMGSKWGDGIHCLVWVDPAGKVTRREYNVSDSTGGHNASRPRKRDLGRRDEIKRLCIEARAEAERKRAYTMARGHQTGIDDLRYCFLATEGRGGHSLYIDEDADSTCVIQGYGLEQKRLDEIDRLGIPYIDSRTVPDSLIVQLTFRAPMPPTKPDKFDPAPWGGMSHAPIPVLAWLYRQYGAIVRNVEPREPLESELRSMKPHEIKALRAYNTGDEAALAEAMSEAREE